MLVGGLILGEAIICGGEIDSVRFKRESKYVTSKGWFDMGVTI